MTACQQMLLGSSAAPLAATSSPVFTYNLGSPSPSSVVSSPITCTPTGGAGGYTYAWVLTLGSGVAINSPSSATTTFSAMLLSGQSETVNAKCIVTSGGVSVDSNTVEIYLEAF